MGARAASPGPKNPESPGRDPRTPDRRVNATVRNPRMAGGRGKGPLFPTSRIPARLAWFLLLGQGMAVTKL